MIYVKFICNTPYCGTESICYQEFKEKDEELFNEIGEELARENGESYEYLINGWGEKSPLRPGEKFKRLQFCNNY